MKLLFTDIDWDTEEDGYVYNLNELGLEQEVLMDIPTNYTTEEIQDMIDNEYTEELVNYLSDHFGWCVFSCDIELVDDDYFIENY